VKPGANGTDYARWDMWCPSDEEDDMINGLTPNNPQFRAMERDIEERHKRCVPPADAALPSPFSNAVFFVCFGAVWPRPPLLHHARCMGGRRAGPQPSRSPSLCNAEWTTIKKTG
jgi:hypothetical protein